MNQVDHNSNNGYPGNNSRLTIDQVIAAIVAFRDQICSDDKQKRLFTAWLILAISLAPAAAFLIVAPLFVASTLVSIMHVILKLSFVVTIIGLFRWGHASLKITITRIITTPSPSLMLQRLALIARARCMTVSVISEVPPLLAYRYFGCRFIVGEVVDQQGTTGIELKGPVAVVEILSGVLGDWGRLCRHDPPRA